MIKRLAIFLGIIQVFVALGAIPAGISMIFDPSGIGLGMSKEMLIKSPFHNFLIPGIFLLVINGLLNVAGSIISFKRNEFTGITGLVLGSLLVVWIIVQVLFLGLIHFLQPLFFIIGIIEMLLGYIFMIKIKSKSPK